jgi:hypothetical protein
VEAGDWSDHQKLQAYVLADIIRTARMNVAKDRAVIMQEMSSQQQLLPVSAAVADNASATTAAGGTAALWKSAEALGQEQQLMTDLESSLAKDR